MRPVSRKLSGWSARIYEIDGLVRTAGWTAVRVASEGTFPFRRGATVARSEFGQDVTVVTNLV
jgi:hypothetical protein